MKFKNYIETESGIKDTSTSPGTAGQVLSSTVTGTSWIDPDTLVSAASKLVVIACKNTSGSTINKGTPVYQTGTVGATDVIEIAPADALISSGNQPAIGLLQTTLNNQGFGNVVITGELLNFTTDPIDGVTPTTGDKVFLKSGGGLTLTKPTGAGNAIQNLGLIGKVSGGNAGSITVSSIMRANDVPNLPTGKIWVGDGNTIVSDTVYLDEVNNRMGIGTTLPSETLTLQTKGDGLGGEGIFIKNPFAGTSPIVNSKSPFLSLATSTTSAYNSTIYMGRNATATNQESKIEWSNANNGLSIYVAGQGSYREHVRFGDLANSTARTFFNGNVGIGATSPSQKLHVSGNLRVTGAYYDSNNSPGTSGQVLSSTATGTDWVLVSDLPIDTRYVAVAGDTMTGGLTMSNAQIQITDSGAQARMSINNTGTGDPQINFQLSGSSKFTIGVDNSDSDKFKISAGSSLGSSDRIVLDSTGNVGIGTTSPAAKLEVEGGNHLFQLSTTSSTGDPYLSFNQAGTRRSFIQHADSGDTLKIVSEYGGIDFFTGTIGVETERMTIQSGGNVGIGTTNPTGKLEVRQAANNGNTGAFTNTHVKLTASATADNTGFVGITAATSTSDNYGYSFGAQRTSGGVGSFKINYHNGIAAGVNRFIIDQNGNVGIGTTSPQDKLDVNGDIAIKNATQLSFDSNNGTLSVASDAGQVNLLNSSIFIKYSSNVGNGTTTPSSKLQVNGGVQLANDTDTASASKVGTFRYYTSGNNSYVDMCMQTGAATYAWVNIVTNSW